MVNVSKNNTPDLRRIYDDNIARDILRSCGLEYSHTATDSRYISKRIGYGICEIYSGQYGNGLIVRRAERRPNKNHLHSVVEYWLEVNSDGKERLDGGCVRQ